MEVEATVTEVDGWNYVVFAQPLELQQPEVAPVPQFVPRNFVPPQQVQPVDWAKIAAALFTIAEHESGRGRYHPN